MLDNEIREQRVLGTVLPAIFLAVAGFLLHVVTAGWWRRSANRSRRSRRWATATARSPCTT
jgi:hypothetical protein